MLFCSIVLLFCSIVLLFCSIVLLFCSIVLLFCSIPESMAQSKAVSPNQSVNASAGMLLFLSKLAGSSWEPFANNTTTAPPVNSDVDNRTGLVIDILKKPKKSYIGSQLNTSPDRSNGQKSDWNAGITRLNTVSGVHPPALCAKRMGRFWLNRKISLLRTPKI